jgi:acyl-CoA thioester hydrolase
MCPSSKVNPAAEPPNGAFELEINILSSDVDQLGHVNNVTYLRWVQDVAIAHWRAIAPLDDQEKLYWVVVRHEIDYLKPALPNDGIAACTWVGEASRFRFERHTQIVRTSDRALLCRALTTWCPISARTGRPTDVSPEVRALFSYK